MNTDNMYWEDYAGQEGNGFQYLGYINYKGDWDFQPISNLRDQVKEIQRRYGKRTFMRIFKEPVHE